MPRPTSNVNLSKGASTIQWTTIDPKLYAHTWNFVKNNVINFYLSKPNTHTHIDSQSQIIIVEKKISKKVYTFQKMVQVGDIEQAIV